MESVINPLCTYGVDSQVKINKKFQCKIVNIFLPIILSICLGAQKNRLIAAICSFTVCQSNHLGITSIQLFIGYQFC